ncbi:MAG: DUF2510 domain-containing protein [Acidimicrobiia bacterium]|nr:DUF2510 domain-containing protein [Acidimicrobiia bacterium]
MRDRHRGSTVDRRGALARPGWYPDPFERHQARFWDGERWTEQVADRARVSVDPLD